jgi:truncated hemoglobin YjbI
MKLAFGDDKKFKKFWSKLTAEVQKKITSNAALSGSKTADRTAVTKIIQDFGDLYKPDNLTKTLRNIFSDPTINDPLNKKMEEKLSNELVNILLTTGRKELAELEKDLLNKGFTNQIRNKWIPILMNLAKTQAVYAPQRANPEFFQDQLGNSLINTTTNTTKGLLQQE